MGASRPPFAQAQAASALPAATCPAPATPSRCGAAAPARRRGRRGTVARTEEGVGRGVVNCCRPPHRARQQGTVVWRAAAALRRPRATRRVRDRAREQRARTFFGCTMSWWLCHPSHTSPKSNAGTPTSRTTCSDISRIVCTRMSVKKLENVSCGASSPAPVWRQSSAEASSQKGRARRSQWL